MFSHSLCCLNMNKNSQCCKVQIEMHVVLEVCICLNSLFMQSNLVTRCHVRLDKCQFSFSIETCLGR